MGHAEVRDWIRDHGEMPTPPYIKRSLVDPEDYQTIYGDEEGSDEEFLKKEDLTAEEEKLRKQMEELKELTGVSLTVADAHAHDKEHHEFSYEELYRSAPENMTEETASTEETKEFIGEQIQELEKMELKEGEENTET